MKPELQITPEMIEVPEGMLEAAKLSFEAAMFKPRRIEETLQAALAWQANNATVPTREQWREIQVDTPTLQPEERIAYWQRQVYLKKEPRVTIDQEALDHAVRSVRRISPAIIVDKELSEEVIRTYLTYKEAHRVGQQSPVAQPSFAHGPHKSSWGDEIPANNEETP